MNLLHDAIRAGGGDEWLGLGTLLVLSDESVDRHLAPIS
jgi:hypothetical protein